MTPIEKALDKARWAPSGDNSQPWRFELIDSVTVKIHSFNLFKSTIQDYHGNYSQFSLGALFENLRVAASEEGTLHIEKLNSDPEHLVYLAKIKKENKGKEELFDALTNRCTNRFPYELRPIEDSIKNALSECLDEGWTLSWYDSLQDKLKIANMLFMFDLAAEPEISGIIEWNCKSSKFRLADETLGLSRANLIIARFIFSSKKRTEWLYKKLGGKYSSALLGFFIPAIRSGAHFTLNAPYELKTPDDFIKAGEQYEKVWLKITKLGLSLQMESGPVIFSRYIRDGQQPYPEPHKQKLLIQLKTKFDSFFKDKSKQIVMLSRIGYANPPTSKSDRLTLNELIYKEDEFEQLSV